MTAAPIPFVKGHGTGNDFVILPDLDGALELSPGMVPALCDRRRGIGADGLLVVRRTADCPDVADQAEVAEYFMDYRNADGSLAQMCGNGARVFVAHLLERGLVGSGSLAIATRGGARSVQISADGATISVDMGPAEIMERDDIKVRAAEWPAGAVAPAIGVHMPNPHAVTWVEDLAEAGALARPPEVIPGEAFSDGVNVEFVQAIGEVHLSMRVHERGVGETLSCGTGACAAAIATLNRAGARPAGQRVRVDVPGGSLEVVWRSDGNVVLQGPVAMVARGTIDPTWWEDHV